MSGQKRTTAGQALRWRRRLALEGALKREFAAQRLDPAELAPMLRADRLVTPARLFAAWMSQALAEAS